MSYLLYLIAAIPLIYFQIQHLFQKTYPVHTTGIVLITGASSGIGRHAAEYLADHTNFTVYAGVRKDTDFKEIESLKKKNLVPILLDVTSPESCAEAVKTLSASSQPLVALVNNAGISRNVILEVHDLKDIRSVFETNVFGVIQLTQMALPLLRKSQGRVVMISSVAGRLSIGKMGAYAGSKFALEALSDAFRRELSHLNISVSVVEPGYVKTPIFKAAREGSSHAAREDIGAEAKGLYAKFFSEKSIAKDAKNHADAADVMVTTEVIVDSIVNAKPKTRYPVAGGAGMPASVFLTLVKILPDRVLDALLDFLLY